MSDEIKETVVEETPLEEAPQVEEAPKEAPKVEEPPKETFIQRNVRLIARSKEKLERANLKLEQEKNEALYKLKTYEEKQKSYLDEDEDEDENSAVVETRKLRKQLELSEKNRQADREERRREKVQDELFKIQDKVLAKYPDYAKVATSMNVAILIEQDEGTTKTIRAEQDTYKKAIMTYDAICKHNIYQHPQTDVEADRETMAKNLAKPMPAHATSKNHPKSGSIFSEIHSKEYQSMLRKELEESKRRI